ncbi:MAG: hypothetical protein NDF56_01465 [archaeon GB-1845-036]|nr:hypothetical protein [Candidatus Culexmicrobium thermophilum]
MKGDGLNIWGKLMEKYFKKIFKTIEKNKMIERNDKIFVALSGGKDSALTLAALKICRHEEY